MPATSLSARLCKHRRTPWMGSALVAGVRGVIPASDGDRCVQACRPEATRLYQSSARAAAAMAAAAPIPAPGPPRPGRQPPLVA
jgi:hypothetical protein